MLVAVLLLTAIVLVAAAAICDIATTTIPNWLSALVAGLFPIAAIAEGLPWHVIAFNIAFAAATLLGCFFLFNGRVLRGGDAKLIPSVAIWTGAAGFGPFALAAGLCGGALAVALVSLRKHVKPHRSLPTFLNRLLDRGRRAPYGVAVAAGAAFALFQTPFADGAFALP